MAQPPAPHQSIRDRKISGRIVHVVSSEGLVVCERCVVAGTPLRRLRGLLGRRELTAGDGILLRPASAIHMCFMRFAIDALFIDRDGVVLRIAEQLEPWRAASKRGARAVLEIAAGECARRGVQVGDRLELRPRTARADG